MKLDLKYQSNVDVTRPELVRSISARVRLCLELVDPHCGEFIIDLDGLPHGATYMVVDADLIEVNIMPLDALNKLLHSNDLPGICEPGTPLF